MLMLMLKAHQTKSWAGLLSLNSPTYLFYVYVRFHRHATAFCCVVMMMMDCDQLTKSTVITRNLNSELLVYGVG